jgi:hypothetical protein
MLTTQDFVSQYEAYTDEELYHAYSNIGDYSEQAQEALNIAIQNRGGIEKLTERLKNIFQIKNEKERIRRETSKLYTTHTSLEFLQNLITSDLLPREATQQIIETTYFEVKSAEEDQKIKPRTVFGSLIGGILGSIVGGVLWGLQMIQMHRIFLFLIVLPLLISYGLIRLFTRQSKSNTMVLVATILSAVGALLIGQLLFAMFG